MNILLMIILAVFLLNIYVGYKKGFLKTVFAIVSWVLVLLICNYATPLVTDFLIEETEVAATVQLTVDQKIAEVIAGAIENSGVSELDASLPAELKELLLGEGVSFEEAIANGITFDTTALVHGIVNIIAFVLVAIFAKIGLALVSVVLGLVTKLPLIGPLDKALGFVFGAGEGMIWCWIILAAISALALAGINAEWAAYISQSPILTWLQENNLLLNLVIGAS